MSLLGCYRVCLYSVFLNTVTTLAKHGHVERMEETKIYCPHCFVFVCFVFFNVFKFSILWHGLRHGVEKKMFKEKNRKTKKVVALDNTIMSNIQFEFCNICMYVWKFCELVMVCTFWHMSVCISSNFKNACFLFFFFLVSFCM